MDKCIDVMTKDPVCCLPNESAETAAQLMRSQNVGSIPVIEDKTTKRLLGIVTDRDLVMKVIAEGEDPKTMRTAQVMSKDPVTCHIDSSVEEVFKAMCDRQVRRIPVVDGSGTLVGIIAQADVALRSGELEKTGVIVKEISRGN